MPDEGWTIAADSARRYSAWLRWLRNKPGASTSLRDAIDRLVDSLDASIKLRQKLTPAEVPFTSEDVTRLVPSEEWQALVNPFSLGYGRESAQLIVMGTEEAYEPTELGVWNCGGAIVRLSDSSLEILRALARGASDEVVAAFQTNKNHGKYHLYPVGYLRDGNPKFRMPTVWSRLAGVLDTIAERLGEVCYQIERSALPSLGSSGGRPPDPDRVRWLEEALPRLPARVLLLHGAVDRPAEKVGWWPRANRRLTAAFLGSTTVLDSHADTPPSTEPVVMESGGRTVIWSTSLSGQNKSFNGAYREKLHDLLRGLGVTRPVAADT